MSEQEERKRPEYDFETPNVSLATVVVPPMDDCMDEYGSYPTALRHQIGEGTVEGHPITIDVTMGGAVYVDFEDGPRVDVKMNALVSAAADAAIEAGYDIKRETESADAE